MEEQVWGRARIMDGKWDIAGISEKMERAELDRLPRGERDSLCIFWDGHSDRAWLVRDDFVDSEQSPAILFVDERSGTITDLGSWPDATFEFWKRELNEDMAQIVRRR